MSEEDTLTAQSEIDLAERAAAPRLTKAVVVSGLYATAGLLPALTERAEASTDDDDDDLSEAITPKPIQPLFGEELRLDVDGRYPQMTASGTIPISKVQRLHWIARIKKTAANTYTGGIWFRDPSTATFPYRNVTIVVNPGPSASARSAKVTFSRTGLTPRVMTYAFKSAYFQKVEFEFDAETSISPGLSIQTHAHPNRPAGLASETLSIQTVFKRCGFNVSTSPNPSTIAAPPGTTWSDMEMHDAMTSFWSRFSATAKWAMWVLFARQHETGNSLGGIMFDDIGPNHRQGTALFYDSFVSSAPAGDLNPAAWVSRMRFWTAVHEMGHAFNLAHSWQKALGTAWIPLANEPEARSFMNYPYNVAGGQTQFFSDFEYRFSNTELLFMRHAPARFVRMGDANWFDNHAFEQVAQHPAPPLSLEIRFNRSRPAYEFMEPVVAELKLKNISSTPQVVDENVLKTLDGITIALKREGSPAKQYMPYARYCMSATPKVLAPGQAIYGSAYLTAGLNGIDVAEPGRYVIQAALHRPDGDIVSAAALLRIAPPRGYEEEVMAQDLFTDAVGRVMAFDGSNVLKGANDTLREVVAKHGDLRIARHALIPLALAVSRPAQVLDLGAGIDPLSAGTDRQTAVLVQAPQMAEARQELTQALRGSGSDVAAESLGHVDYKNYVDKLTDLLERQGDTQEATKVQQEMKTLLEARNVLPRVLGEIDTRIQSLEGEAAKGA
jgi:hypothetical protein